MSSLAMEKKALKVSNPVIHVRDLLKTYILGDSRINALEQVNFVVNAGSFLTVMGPSGSGKSTLLNIIAGLEKPTGGEVLILGTNIHHLSDRKASAFRKKYLGFIFQFFNLHPTLTAEENVELPLILSRMKKQDRQKRVVELLEMVGMSHRADHFPHELSGGEQQRIAIARALANDPVIILADEPTGDLDSATGEEIKQLLIRLNRVEKKTFVLVTHDYRMVEPFMTLIKLQDGKIKEKKEPSELNAQIDSM